MKIGFHLPQLGELATRDAVLAVARAAEELGYASVWVGDHIAFPVETTTPYPYTPDGSLPLDRTDAFLEALTTVAVVAGATERISLGTSVMVLPLREVVTVGRQVATLAALAPGRVVLGVGAGWLREEYEVLGRDFPARGAVLDEQIEALRGLWTEPGSSYEGTHVAFPALYAEPRPEPVPEVWVGGNAGAALRRAGRLGDAWHAAGIPPAETLQGQLAVVADAARAAGRDPASVRFTARTTVTSGPDGMATLARRLDRLRQFDCDHLLVDPRASSLDELLALCEAVAGAAVAG